jgi:hypothetical protein
MLDVSTGRVYAFVFNDGGVAGTNCSSPPCRAVIDFPGNFVTGSTGTKVRIGSGNSTTGVQFNGAFDDAWFTSTNSTGAMYVCGGVAGNPNRSQLWRIPITAGALGTAQAGARVSGGAASTCSPVTSVKNGADEYLYFGLTANGFDGASTVCTGACVYQYNLADLDGSSTDVKETWTVTFAPSPNFPIAGETVVINGITLVCGTDWPSCGAGSAGVRAARFASAVNLVSDTTGITATRAAAVVTLTYFVGGNVADGLVVENLSNVSMTHSDGSVQVLAVPWGPTNAPVAGLATPAGNGGLVIDNVSSAVGASQVYFGQLRASGNAVQASQAGLQ